MVDWAKFSIADFVIRLIFFFLDLLVSINFGFQIHNLFITFKRNNDIVKEGLSVIVLNQNC